MHIRTTFTFAASLGLGALSAAAVAGPTGGVVVEGQGTISTPTAGTTVIDQSSNQLHLNWNSFDVGASESVQFHQPSSTATAFNRILDQNPSQIFGHVEANGRVVLVNPNGLLIGRTAQLNVNSLVVSSLDAIDFDAASGRYRFSATRNDPGAVINEGAITAGYGGSVTLLGGRVSNSGSIVADYGTVNLAAGRAATLDLAGDGLLRLEVNADLLTNSSGSASAVENSGTIQSNGGQVLLTANAVKDVFANLINNTGVVRANRIDNSGGTIQLLGPEGTVLSSGTLDASAGDATSAGGKVAVLGERVGLVGSAVVDVSGASGGTALIGGDYQGSNPDVLNAQRTYVSNDATINADVGANGDGGRVIVWSNEYTRFNGRISARGGTFSGNGGFAEVSGEQGLLFNGDATLSAAHGTAGTLLLDPNDLTIDNGTADPTGGTGSLDFNDPPGNGATIGASVIEGLLAGGTSVSLKAKDSIHQLGGHVADIDVSADALAANKTLTLESQGTIQLDGDITLNGGAFTLDANSKTIIGNSIALNGNVTTNGGPVSITGGQVTTAGGSVIDAGAGGITLTARGDINLGGSLAATNAAVGLTTTTSGKITMTGASQITAGNGLVSLSAQDDVQVTKITTTGTANITSTGNIIDDQDQTTSIAAGPLTLTASSGAIGGSGLNQDIDTQASSLTATASSGVYVREQGGVTLNNIDAGSGPITLSASGAISVGANRQVQTTGGPVSITADSITTNSNSVIDGGNNSITLLANNNDIVLGGALTTNNAAVSVTATGTSGAITMTPVATIDAGNGVVTLLAKNNVTVAGITTTGSASITSNSGSILDDLVPPVPGTFIKAGALTLSAVNGAIGGPASNAEIDTQVTTLTAHSANGVYVREQGDVTINDVDAGTGAVALNASGDVTLAGGHQVRSSGGTISVTAGAITASGGNTIDAGNSAITLTANTNDIVLGGSMVAVGTAPISVTANGTNGAITMNAGSTIGTGATAGAVTLAAKNNVVVTSINTTGNASISSTSGNIVDDAGVGTVIKASGLTLTASAGTIGGAGNAAIDTQVTSLDANGGHGVFVNQQGALTVNDVNGGNGAITLSSDNAVSLAAGHTVQTTGTTGSVSITGTALTTGSGSSINGGSGGVTLTANTNDIALGGAVTTSNAPISATASNGALTMNTGSTIGAGNGGITLSAKNAVTVTGIDTTGTASVTSTSGSIVDDLDPLTVLKAGTLNLTAATGSIGGSGANADIDTQVGTLNATAANGVYIHEADGLTLNDVKTTVAGDVNVRSASGDITAGAVKALNRVTLTADSGGILDDSSDSTVIEGTVGIALTAQSGIGNVTTFETGAGSSIDVKTNGDLSASVASNAGHINLNLTGTPTFGLNAITLGNGPASNGTLVLQSTADLNVAGFGANAIKIGAGNTARVGLISGGTLTLPAGNGFMDASANTLLVHGATDVVDVNGRQLGLKASTLDFQSGGAGGDTILDTTVDRLDASIGNNRNLRINETDALTLGAITTAGNVVITAGGAIADDDNDNTRISGNTVDLTANALGAQDHELDTQATTLTANASAGGIFVRELDGLVLTAHATGGAVDVQTAGGALTVAAASGSGVTLASGGAANDLTLNGVIDGSGGPVKLTAGRAIVAGGGNQVLGNAVTASGTAIGAGGARLNTSAGSLAATATNGGIFVTEADALSLAANASGGAVDVQTNSGSLAVSSASGTNITLTAGGDGSQINVNGALNATGGNVALTAGTPALRGAITSNAGQVTANTLTAVGTSIGANGLQLNTAVQSLDATATNGGIYVQQTGALALTANATGGELQVATLTGPMTVASAAGNGVTLATLDGGSDLTVNGPVNGGAGQTNLTAGGALTLNGAVKTSGDMMLTSGAGSALTLNSSVNARGLTITAGPVNARGAIVAGAGNQINASDVTLRGSAVGATTAKLNTAVDSIDALTSNGGVFVSEADGLALNAATTNGALDVRSANGALTVASAVGDGVTLAAGGAGNGITLTGGIQGRNGDVTLTTSGAGGNITLGGPVSSTGTVSVLASGDGSNIALNSTIGTTGDITVGAGSAAGRGAITAGASSNLSGSTVNVVGSAIGAAGARLNTAATSLNAISTNGGIFVNQTGSLGLTANATGGAVDVQSSGALTVAAASGNGVTLKATGAGAGIALNGAVNAGTGAATLNAVGAITANAGNQVTATSLTATGSSIGAPANRLNTNVATLNATSTGGGTFITEADGLTLAASATGGALDVQTGNGALVVSNAAGTGVTLTAGGAGSSITLNGTVDAGTGDVTLTAGTTTNRGAIAVGAGGRVNGATFTAAGSTVGSAAAPLSTSIDTLRATASTGDVYVREQNDLKLADVHAAGSVDISSASGNMTVTTVNAGNNVTLSASSGAIADDADDTTMLSGKAVTLLARSIGAPSTLTGATLDKKPRLDIDAMTLDARATGGGVYIDSLHGLSSVSAQASGGANGDIELLTASGDLNLLNVSASDTLLLAAGGNIYALPGLTAISARAAELRAGAADANAGHIGTLTAPLSLQLSAGSTLHIFVPQTIDPSDSNRAPSTLPNSGVLSTLSLFGSPSSLALQAGFGQFQGLGDSQFTSPAEFLVRSIQNQTATVQTVLGLDWASFDPNVSLFGTLDPSVCLPADQRDEEQDRSGC